MFCSLPLTCALSLIQIVKKITNGLNKLENIENDVYYTGCSGTSNGYFENRFRTSN